VNGSTTARVPFADLAGFGSLFETYCTDFDSVRSFYRRDWRDPQSIAEAVADAASYPRDRETLVDVIREQNKRWNAQEGTLHNIERLRDPRSVAVVTGQQVGLFTGPMYTVIKTVTTIQLARHIEEETGHPCVPVFWLEGEDHDFAEAASIHLPDSGGLTTISMDADELRTKQNTGPVGRLKLGDQIHALIDQVESSIPPTEFRSALISALRETYRPEVTVRDAFAELMRRLLPDEGLVFISPDSMRLKTLLTPLFKKEILDYQTSFNRLSTRSNDIATSFKPQIHPHEMNLFMLEDEGRIRLDPSAAGDRFELRGLDRAHTADELIGLLEENPCRFSPNVVMRPISQDHLLPTAAYVAGPGEISYFAQLGPVYDWAGVPMPVIYPRASITLVEGRVRKSIDKLGLSFSDLSGDTAAIVRDKTLSEIDFDLDDLFDKKIAAVEEELGEIKVRALSLDPSLGRSVESTMAAIRKQLEGVKMKLVRAAKRNNEQIGQSVEKATQGLFPGGKLQERVVSPLYFSGKYGLDFPADLIDTLSLETDRHQVIDI
jgi:bacillithiol biosynthesis cysteine-adding enzyme BshC